MKILGKQPSREKCAESGWFATDYLLDAPIDRAFILSLRPLGSFVYLDMLKAYGQGGVVKIPNKHVEHFKRSFKYHEKHESLPDEAAAQYFRFWVGSSAYSTREMSILIDGVVQEAKTPGIETATPEELERLKAGWKDA